MISFPYPMRETLHLGPYLVVTSIPSHLFFIAVTIILDLSLSGQLSSPLSPSPGGWLSPLSLSLSGRLSSPLSLSLSLSLSGRLSPLSLSQRVWMRRRVWRKESVGACKREFLSTHQNKKGLVTLLLCRALFVTHTQTDRRTERYRDRETDTHTQTDGQTDGRTERQRDRDTS